MVITDRRCEALDVVSVRLERPDGEPLPRWSAGAHIDLHLPSGNIRQYSLCGRESDHGYQVAVLVQPDGRGGSVEAASLETGTELTISHPRNQFPLTPAGRYLLIAGGIGITPLLAMVRSLESRGADWSLVYGGRTRESMAFVAELETFGGRIALIPEDECGMLDLAQIFEGLPPDTAVYCCGPAGLLSAVEAHHRERSASAWLHMERFTPSESRSTAEDSSFTVVMNRSRATVMVTPDQSILSAARQVCSTLPSSCEEGHCGTCETTVLVGLPDHRDEFLTDDERASNATMMICVSRSLSAELVLDL